MQYFFAGWHLWPDTTVACQPLKTRPTPADKAGQPTNPVSRALPYIWTDQLRLWNKSPSHASNSWLVVYTMDYLIYGRVLKIIDRHHHTYSLV